MVWMFHLDAKTTADDPCRIDSLIKYKSFPSKISKANVPLSVIEDGIIVAQESVSQDPLPCHRASAADNASDAVVRSVETRTEV
jgi:hypothetical protein